MMYINELTSRKQIEKFAIVLSRRSYKTDREERPDAERMADWGEAAVALGAPDFSIGRNGIESDVIDAVANIMHFCDRAGIDGGDIIRRAINSYDNDLDDPDDCPPAERDLEMYPDESHRL